MTIDRCADEELLQRAQAAGCLYFFIGLKTFTEDGLASVDKGFNRASRYRATIELIHRHGICVQAGINFGLEADTRDVFADTLQALGIDGATASPLTPLPGTRFHEEMQREGRLLSAKFSL